MYTNAIVGFGPAGIFTLACLPQSELSKTLVLEPSCAGGDLLAMYGTVVANITAQDILNAFRKIPRWQSKSMPILEAYAPDACPTLADACRQMLDLVAEDRKQADYRTKRAVAYARTAAGTWKITAEDDSVFETQKLILCVGGKTKHLDLPVLSIPLSIALTPSLLKQHVTPNSRVVVFGTSHSGTLILKNLKDLGVSRVAAIYNTPKPFYYARDGDTEGIKQEAAAIADEIVARAWGDKTPELLNYCDFSSVYRTVHAADRVVYAIGFSQPKLTYTDVEQKTHPLVTNKDIGVYGFGMAYPRHYTAPNGNKYFDIGFGPFIDAILADLAQ